MARVATAAQCAVWIDLDGVWGRKRKGEGGTDDLVALSFASGSVA